MPTPPPEVRRVAREALEDRRKYGRGGTAVRVARARDLANGRDVSVDTLRRMVSFFARHGAQRPEIRQDRTTPASIAWRLWGGTPGRAWARRELAKAEREGP